VRRALHAPTLTRPPAACAQHSAIGAASTAGGVAIKAALRKHAIATFDCADRESHHWLPGYRGEDAELDELPPGEMDFHPDTRWDRMRVVHCVARAATGTRAVRVRGCPVFTRFRIGANRPRAATRAPS
jgi:hypothetical protein